MSVPGFVGQGDHVLPGHAQLRSVGHPLGCSARSPADDPVVDIGGEPVHEAQRLESADVFQERPGEQRWVVEAVTGPDDLEGLDAAPGLRELESELVSPLGHDHVQRGPIARLVMHLVGDARVRGDHVDRRPAPERHPVGPSRPGHAGLTGHQQDAEVPDRPPVGAKRRGLVPGRVGRAEASALTDQIHVDRGGRPIGNAGQVDPDLGPRGDDRGAGGRRGGRGTPSSAAGRHGCDQAAG